MKYFGTDGIRDRVKGPLLEPDFVYQLGRAVGRWTKRKPSSSSHHIAIGRDTRHSAGYLFLALVRGLGKEGVKTFDAGVCPTPAVATAVRDLGVDMGIVITASHNPASDNGIKLFGPGGCKLRESEEVEIEEILDNLSHQVEDFAFTPPVRYYEARRHYLDGCSKILPDHSLMGLRVVVDCSNGASFRTTPELLWRLGAQVIPIGDQPDGKNINAGVGSEHPEVICKAVLANEADLGIAHDGDGDRVILSSHKGQVLDGDAVLAILGKGWAARGELDGNTVVATIMSNLGLDKCLSKSGVSLNRVGVGDRQVFYEMQDKGFVLGGESSGHFIAMKYLPTGDGLLAALLVIREMLSSESTLDQLASAFQPFPQFKKNLPVRRKPSLEKIPDLQEALGAMEARLGKRGRILLRYSGTEPKIRLLAEAEDASLAESTMKDLEDIVRTHLEVAKSNSL